MKPILTTTRSLFKVPAFDLNSPELLYLYDRRGKEMQSYCDEPLTILNTAPTISHKKYGFPEMWVNNKVYNILLINEARERRMVYVGG